MIGIDTNVLVRYVVQDDARQSATAGHFIETTLSDDEPGWTEVPDRQLLTAAPSHVTVRPLSSITEGIGIR